MKDRELVKIATSFRRGLLGKKSSWMMSAAYWPVPYGDAPDPDKIRSALIAGIDKILGEVK